MKVILCVQFNFILILSDFFLTYLFKCNVLKIKRGCDINVHISDLLVISVCECVREGGGWVGGGDAARTRPYGMGT